MSTKTSKGAQSDPKSFPKHPKRRPEEAHSHPNVSQRWHKRAQKGPKKSPKSPKECQRVPNSTPGVPPMAPRSPLEWTKSGPRAAQGSQTCPKSLPQSAQEHSQRVPSRSQRLLRRFSVPALPHQVPRSALRGLRGFLDFSHL